MTDPSVFEQLHADGAPFGTRPRRSAGPLIPLLLLLLGWFGVLIWMVLRHRGF